VQKNTEHALTLAMQPAIEAALAAVRTGSGAQCLSDWAFSNLWLFRTAHDYRYCGGDLPGICGTTYDGARHFLPLFDLAQAARCAPQKLHALARHHGCLYPLSSAQAKALPAALFQLHCAPHDADYLYRAETLRHYAGRALAKKRNQVRQLIAAHGKPRHAAFDAAAHAAACTAVLRGWMRHKGKAAGEADESACLEALRHATRFGMEGLVFYATAQPIGFVLVQELQPAVLVVRFAKGLDSHIGIYPYMFQQLSRAFARPVAWLNFEQDMGHAGFRRSKRSYQPSSLLDKWRAVPV